MKIYYFPDWLLARVEDADFELVEVVTLAELLKKFYAEVRTKTCAHYRHAAYVSLFTRKQFVQKI